MTYTEALKETVLDLFFQGDICMNIHKKEVDFSAFKYSKNRYSIEKNTLSLNLTMFYTTVNYFNPEQLKSIQTSLNNLLEYDELVILIRDFLKNKTGNNEIKVY